MRYERLESSEEGIAEKTNVEEPLEKRKIIKRNKNGRQDGTPKRAALSALLCLFLAVAMSGNLTGCGTIGVQTESGANAGGGQNAAEAGTEDSNTGEEGISRQDSTDDGDTKAGESDTEESSIQKSQDGEQIQSDAAEEESVLSLDEIHMGEGSFSTSQAIDAMEEADSLADCLNTASSGQTQNWESAGLTPAQFVSLAASQGQSYYFSQLQEKKQYQRELIYLLLQYMVEERAEKIEIPCKDTEEITEIFTMVTDDHPECFDVSGYQSQIYTDQLDAVTHITLTGKYSMEEQEREQLREEMKPVLRKVLQDASTLGNDYEKARYVYEYVIGQTDYDQDASYNQTMCSVFIYGKSVCQGYARAAQYLLQQLGIPCVIAAGEVHDGVRHAWDIVRVDGAWYHMDPTWGDPSYASDEDAAVMGEYINYDYLLITTEEISRTHTLYQEDTLPECTATADNYYVREGYFLEKWDRETFKLMLAAQEQEGNKFPSVKCASREIFEEMKQDLVSQGHLSECLPAGRSTGRVRYTENTDLYTMTVLLP